MKQGGDRHGQASPKEVIRNTETESETARESVDGIKELYAYAASLLPQ